MEAIQATEGVSSVSACLHVLRSHVRGCEEIIEAHKSRRPFLTDENWGYDDGYRVIPVDQYVWLENVMSAVRECINDLDKTLRGDGSMHISGLISLLEELKAQHGDMQVFGGDMVTPLLEVREADDKELYGEMYVYIAAE